MPDKPLQALQVASSPGLSIALRNDEIPGFWQWGQRNILIII